MSENKPKRTLKRLNNKEFLLTIEDEKVRSKTEIIHTKDQLIEVYQELTDLLSGLNHQIAGLKRDLDKLPEVKDPDEIRALRDKLNQIDALNKTDQLKQKIEDVQKTKIEWMSQKEEIFHAFPEVERAKKKKNNK